MTKVAPSLLSADFCNMEQGVRMMECAGADYLHCDVMDGVFVPNISFGFQMISRLHDISDLPLDVHLMIVQPERYIERFAQAGADFITVHAEATDHLQRVLKQITQCGKKPGVVLNPATPLEMVRYILDDVDMILLMSVNPGYGGQSFIPAVMRKVADSRDDRRVGQGNRYRSGWWRGHAELYTAPGGRCDRPCRGQRCVWCGRSGVGGTYAAGGVK